MNTKYKTKKNNYKNQKNSTNNANSVLFAWHNRTECKYCVTRLAQKY